MGDRWVTFDCFGTIVDWNAALADALVSVFGDEPRAQLIDDFHQAERDGKHADGFQLYRDVLAGSMRQMGLARGRVLLDDEEAAIARAWPSIVPFADSPAGLEELRARGWRLAILTNCDDDLFAVTRAQIPVPIDEAVTAQSISSYKPDLLHFEEFRRRVEPAAWVHAANSWEHDIEPAARLGLPRVWVDRDRSGHDASLASERITGFAALADAVDRVAASG
jgi:2-haloacid dehalogenase